MKNNIMLLACLLGAPAAGWAQESEHAFKFTAWAASDYMYRGVSQNDNDPVLQAALDYTHSSGLYAGVWASPVDFGASVGADVEWDTYVGYAFPLNERWGADIQLVRYNYTGTHDGHDIEYNELIGKLTYAERYSLMAGYSNDVFASGENGLYLNLGGTWSLPHEFSLAASVGYYDLSDGDSYADFSVGASRDFGPVNLALSYVGTDGEGEDLFGDLAEPRLVFAAKMEFE